VSLVFANLSGAAAGATVYAQVGVIDFASPIGFPIAMSDGLAITFQP